MIIYVIIHKKDVDDRQLNYITDMFYKIERLYKTEEPYLVINLKHLNYFTLISSVNPETAINLNKEQFNKVFKLLIIDKELAISYINTLRGS